MGSAWPVRYCTFRKKPTYKLIVAPHDLKYVPHIKKQLKGLLYSQADESNVRDPKVLIIDNIGLLASIYKYADVAYIGGAFDSDLHNILEAAVYGCPLLFGPKHHNFPEAAELISVGGAKSISNKEEFQKAVNDYLNEAPKDDILQYCESKRGASEKMWQGIFN